MSHFSILRSCAISKNAYFSNTCAKMRPPGPSISLLFSSGCIFCAVAIRYEIQRLATFLVLIWHVYLRSCKITCVFLEYVFKLSNCYNIGLAQIHRKTRISRTRVCITNRCVSHVFLTKCMLQRNRRIARTRVQKKVPTNF